MWTSDAITTANPLVVCALIGPAAIFAAKPPSYNDDAAVTTLRSLEWQILDLVLNSFAEYWEIGQHMHCKSCQFYLTRIASESARRR